MTKIKAMLLKTGGLLSKHPLIFFIVLSLLENLLIESLSRHSLFEGIGYFISHPFMFLTNTLIILLTLSFSLLFRRRLFGIVLLSIPWIACGVANCVVLTFRVTPLSAIDLQIVKASFILMYLSQTQRIILYCAIAVFLIGITVLWIVGPKISGKINYGKNTATITGLLICTLIISNVAQSIRVKNNSFSSLDTAYKDYGFAYCFSSSVLNTGIDEPPGYTQENLNLLLEKLPQTTNVSDKAKPDVVFIQLESFIDPKFIKDVTFSDDPAPTHTQLRNNYSGGKLSVPSVGGGTANTEFEVLTGINLDNFGPGEYPYKTILLEETCESIAYNLKENGYSTHAIHNHSGSFYDRDKVYPSLGFDSFQSQEYMYGYETTPYGWCKDKVLTEEIIKALTHSDSENDISRDSPRFVWAVSVQGHGKYPSTPIPGDDNVIKIESEKFTAEELCALQYYVNQMWEMDMFLGSLIAALKDYDRPVILVAYGDHLPALNLTAEDYTTNNLYQTEYVTWNNFGLEKKTADLCTYELASEIMQQLGFNNGNLTKLHQMANSDESPLGDSDYQAAMLALSYDMLYGKGYQFNGEKPFQKTLMRMGTLPVIADKIQLLGEALYVQGSGFTEKSSIFINGKKQDTVMLSQYSLMASGITLTEGDSVTIGQSSSKKEVLSYSEPIIYKEAEHFYSNE